MGKVNKTVFIAWVPTNPRSFGLSEQLKCKKLFIDHLIKSRGVLWKLLSWLDYLYKTVRTLAFLFKEKPNVVFTQSPPSFCPMISLIYCMLTKSKLVIDAHNGSFGKPWITIPFYKKTMEHAFLVLIHNKEFYNYLNNLYTKVNFYKLNDKIVNRAEALSDSEIKYFLVVLSYSPDEPVVKILKAIKLFVEDNNTEFKFKLTGNYKKRIDLHEKFKTTKGIEFLGFVQDEVYVKLLKKAYGIIALTKGMMTQQCAAIEAIGAHVPMISSSTKTNKNIFFKGAILTTNDIKSIKKSIKDFIVRKEELAQGIKEVHKVMDEQWDKDFKGLKEIIGI